MAALRACPHFDGTPAPDKPSSNSKPWNPTNKGKGQHHLLGFNIIFLINSNDLSEEPGLEFHVFGQKADTSFIHSLVFIIDRASCVNRHWIAPLSLSSSSIEWSVCWRGDHRQCGMGLFGSVKPFASLAITLSQVSVFLTPSLQLGDRKRLSATVDLLCLVSVAMAMCRDGKNAAPRCWISRNPPADAGPGYKNLLPHPC